MMKQIVISCTEIKLPKQTHYDGRPRLQEVSVFIPQLPLSTAVALATARLHAYLLCCGFSQTRPPPLTKASFKKKKQIYPSQNCSPPELNWQLQTGFQNLHRRTDREAHNHTRLHSGFTRDPRSIPNPPEVNT